ncbi:ATP-binding cassette domain-containing protein [Herbaspirillum sp. alder98]|uniref:ATP-binding cassette domain-containing protein n=1 Tax=Herbaspirillum sp. alder98 TaxID=2913096 RepID=UPI001CD88ECF|nr:ATP-binding cassette domain-containing protein [Herbaspirillum sp. alder98]MCA1323012.1 ATP-binding cassette domain-containing protein [Herbaspirillum sp. alder98]
MTAAPAIWLNDLSFTWPRQAAPALVLDDLRVEAGQQVFVSGPSGSGKSTLLAIIGGIIIAQRGSVSVLGQPLQSLAASRRDRFRVDHLGFIFQQFNLLPYLSVIDNVLLPCRFSPIRRERALQHADDLPQAARALLASLDLAPALWMRDVAQLSIGQQQRVAAARALIGRPDIIIADEPTSALDSDRQQGFLDLLQQQCRHSASALVFVSHDLRLAQRFDTRIALEQINRASAAEDLA